MNSDAKTITMIYDFELVEKVGKINKTLRGIESSGRIELTAKRKLFRRMYTVVIYNHAKFVTSLTGTRTEIAIYLLGIVSGFTMAGCYN